MTTNYVHACTNRAHKCPLASCDYFSIAVVLSPAVKKVTSGPDQECSCPVARSSPRALRNPGGVAPIKPNPTHFNGDDEHAR